MRKFLSPFSDHMRHAHRVEDTGMGRGWRGEIDVAIEVEQTKILDVAHIASQDSKSNRAVSTDDHWSQMLREYLVHPICYPPGNFNHTREILLLAVRTPRLVERQGQVTE